MKRFLVEPDQIVSGEVRLEGPEARHAQKVLRKTIGDEVLLVDGNNHEYRAIIISSDKNGISAEILEERLLGNEPDLDFTLGLSMLKSDRMDMVIQKATELGVTTLVPLETDRSVIRLDRNRAEKRLERWRSIARQSVKQCGRPRPVNVRPISSLQQFLNNGRTADLKILFHPADVPGSKTASWRELLGSGSLIQTVRIVIGPEGGFSPEEALIVMDNGFTRLSLGPRILRAETAAVAAMAIIGFELGDLSKIP